MVELILPIEGDRKKATGNFKQTGNGEVLDMRVRQSREKEHLGM